MLGGVCRVPLQTCLTRRLWQLDLFFGVHSIPSYTLGRLSLLREGRMLMP